MTTTRRKLWEATEEAMAEAEVILQARKKAAASAADSDAAVSEADIEKTICALAKASYETAAPEGKRAQMLADTAMAMAEAEKILRTRKA